MNVQFSENDWQRIRHDWNQWSAGDLDRALIVLETSDPLEGADYSQLTKFGLDTPVDEVIDNWQRIFEATH